MRLNWGHRKAKPAATRWPGSGFSESTLAQVAWERKRKVVARWGWAGVLFGTLAALLAFAPAAWIADAVSARTHQRLLLTDARGTIWSGSAVPVLTGGPDSRSATTLPGRTSWTLALRGLALELRLRQSCCIADALVFQIRPGLGSMQVQLVPGAGVLGEWPAAWLSGLGAPWNSLQLGGTLQLSSPGMSLEGNAGRWRIAGQADLDFSDISSQLSTLARLGSYRLHVDGAGADGAGPAFALSTLEGSLLLSGQGLWTGAQLRFRGEARAAPGFEGALDNLLNIFGRRQGALSLISIG
jgi:general secretion pathway protein N